MPKKIARLIQQTLLLVIVLYKKSIAPWLGAHCRFAPSCSAYMYNAIEKYGTARGLWLGFKRLLRCHPLSPGGIDPVPEDLRPC